MASQLKCWSVEPRVIIAWDLSFVSIPPYTGLHTFLQHPATLASSIFVAFWQLSSLHPGVHQMEKLWSWYSTSALCLSGSTTFISGCEWLVGFHRQSTMLPVNCSLSHWFNRHFNSLLNYCSAHLGNVGLILLPLDELWNVTGSFCCASVMLMTVLRNVVDETVDIWSQQILDIASAFWWSLPALPFFGSSPLATGGLL